MTGPAVVLCRSQSTGQLQTGRQGLGHRGLLVNAIGGHVLLKPRELAPNQPTLALLHQPC